MCISRICADENISLLTSVKVRLLKSFDAWRRARGSDYDLCILFRKNTPRRERRTTATTHVRWVRLPNTITQFPDTRCEIEPVLVASMATTLLEGLVSSALAGNELFESLFRAAGPCLLVEAWRDAGAPRAFDGTALPGWSPNAGYLLATRSPSMKCVPVVSEPSVPYCTS